MISPLSVPVKRGADFFAFGSFHRSARCDDAMGVVDDRAVNDVGDGGSAIRSCHFILGAWAAISVDLRSYESRHAKIDQSSGDGDR